MVTERRDIDTLISYKQRIYYENMLATHIDRKVLKRNLNNIDNFDGDMNQYKTKVSMCWYYLTCAFFGSNYVINDTQAFDDIEKNQNIIMEQKKATLSQTRR